MYTIAGTGSAGSASDGGVATSSPVNNAEGVFSDTSGNILFTENANYRVRKVNLDSGITRVLAGSGSPGSLGNGGAATNAQLSSPGGVGATTSGTVIIGDTGNKNFRKITPDGIITNYVGTGATSSVPTALNGDGGAATSATIGSLGGQLSLDGSGNLYFVDKASFKLRKVSASSQIITTIAGTGTDGSTGNGYPATSATIRDSWGAFVDSTGVIYISQAGSEHRIRRIVDGIMYSFMGYGSSGTQTENAPFSSTVLKRPMGVWGNAAGDLFYADNRNRVIRVASAATGRVNSIAGTGASSASIFAPTGPALSIVTLDVCGVSVDDSGQVFFADWASDTGGNAVRALFVPPTVPIYQFYAVAGTGTEGAAVSNVVVSSSTGISKPEQVYATPGGEYLYITDNGNRRIRKHDFETGLSIAKAGTGSTGTSGDGGRATSAQLSSPRGVCATTSGVMFISDFDVHRIRKVGLDSIITTVVGTGSPSSGATNANGDGGQATSATVWNPNYLALDADFNLYFADYSNRRIRKLNAVTQIITNFAGDGNPSSSGDGGYATSASINYPNAVFVDSIGKVYLSDNGGNRIRVVGTDNIITLFAGTGGAYANNLPRTSTGINRPIGIWGNTVGDLYYADKNNYRIRVVFAYNGVVSTIAGSGASTTASFVGSGAALDMYITCPMGVGGDGSGNLYFSDNTVNVGGSNIRGLYATTASPTVTPTSTPTRVPSATPTISFQPSSAPSVPVYQMYVVAGNGAQVTGAANGAVATSSSMKWPEGVYADPGGDDIYFCESEDKRYRRVNKGDGVTLYFVGNGQSGTNGDGGQATSAQLSGPRDIVGLATAGVFYLTMFDGNRVRKVATNGIISTYVGTGSASSSATTANGDGGAATSATLKNPYMIAADTASNIYFVDQSNYKVRKVIAATQFIVNVIGNGNTGSSTGDGGRGTGATVNNPLGVFVDSVGKVYVTEQNGNRIRVLAINNIISLLVGNGNTATVNNVPGTSTGLSTLAGIWGDTVGNIFFVEQNNRYLRVLSAFSGLVTTIAGTGSSSGTFSRTGPALTIVIQKPTGVSGDRNGHIYYVENDVHSAVRGMSEGTQPPSRSPISPSRMPSVVPSILPTVTPSRVPSATPSITPSRVPSASPTTVPTITPSRIPSMTPSITPTATPTATPSSAPTCIPSTSPSRTPTATPSSQVPTVPPSRPPTVVPSRVPSATPTTIPSIAPSWTPSQMPSRGSTVAPSSIPTTSPTITPSLSPTAIVFQTTKAFSFTGSVQTFTVPAGVTLLKVEMVGARGGNALEIAYGGYGAHVLAYLTVTPGTTLYIYIGNKAEDTIKSTGGYNGGGDGGSVGGSGGGGASDIRTVIGAIYSRIVVAGGGGGAYACASVHGGASGLVGVAGSGGALCNPSCTVGGAGATATSVGNGACCGTCGLAGVSGVGGSGGSLYGTGGGGGYFGGGGGYATGGGGGSSYINPAYGTGTITSGVGSGAGSLNITYTTSSTPNPTAVPTKVPITLPSLVPSSALSLVPSRVPSAIPTAAPSFTPTVLPSTVPSGLPTDSPVAPSKQPSIPPTRQPSQQPSAAPTRAPTLPPLLEPVSSIIATYLSSSSIQFPGVTATSLDQVTITLAQMIGTSVKDQPQSPSICVLESGDYTETVRTYILYLNENQDGYIKMISVTLFIIDESIYAAITDGTRHNTAIGIGLSCSTVNEQYENGNVGAYAATADDPGYGVANLAIMVTIPGTNVPTQSPTIGFGFSGFLTTTNQQIVGVSVTTLSEINLVSALMNGAAIDNPPQVPVGVCYRTAAGQTALTKFMIYYVNGNQDNKIKMVAVQFTVASGMLYARADSAKFTTDPGPNPSCTTVNSLFESGSSSKTVATNAAMDGYGVSNLVVSVSSPSNAPSPTPTRSPSTAPSITPSTTPSVLPSTTPTYFPSVFPSITPTIKPTTAPSVTPSVLPSTTPTTVPSVTPTVTPSASPSIAPTNSPSVSPSVSPSITPSLSPSCTPTSLTPTSLTPTNVPSESPSITPSMIPSTEPSTFVPVSSTIVPWLTYSDQQFPGVSAPSMDWVRISDVTLAGNSVATNTPNMCLLTSAANSATSQTYIFYRNPVGDSYIKMVSVQISIVAGNIFAKAVEPKHNFNPGASSSCDVINTAFTVNANPSVLSSGYSIPDYGINMLRITVSQPTITPTIAPTAPVPVYSTLTPWLTFDNQPFPSVTTTSLDWVSIYEAVISGYSVDAQWSSVCLLTSAANTAISKSFIFYVNPDIDSLLKMVSVEISLFGGVIYAKAIAVRNSPNPGNGASCSVVNTLYETNYISVSLASSPTTNHYGIYNLQIRVSPETVSPTRSPTISLRPTPHPSITPSTSPTPPPTIMPTCTPSITPSAIPSTLPTILPSCSPTAVPSVLPSVDPTIFPTIEPSAIPTCQPTTLPTTQPSSEPTAIPSISPTSAPSCVPTTEPSNAPSCEPSSSPTTLPSTVPSEVPSSDPSVRPSIAPTLEPSITPSVTPSESPTKEQTTAPTVVPSSLPTIEPTITPSISPSVAPSSEPSADPSPRPSTTPTTTPIDLPSHLPTCEPSEQPSEGPSVVPSEHPSIAPSVAPSNAPIDNPTSPPSASPSGNPSIYPTFEPTTCPSVELTTSPTSAPSHKPSQEPTKVPSPYPSTSPSQAPSTVPSYVPTQVPSETPSYFPTATPSSLPTLLPTCTPTNTLTIQPTLLPTSEPTITPSTAPSQPTFAPSLLSLATLPHTRGVSLVLEGKSVNISVGAIIVLPFLRVTPTSQILASNGFYDVSIDNMPSAGTNYVLYGSASMAGNILLPWTNHGFVATPAVSYDYSGRSVSNAGDINGDGYDDLVIGVPYAARCYVLFGTAQGFMNMTEGFTIFGAQASDLTGWSVSGAGDVNNDTFADIMIGAPHTRHDNIVSGAVYVLYGKQSGFKDVSLAQLSPQQGFAIFGSAEGDALGVSVSTAGDVNGDGSSDIVVGALKTGALYRGGAYVIYGSPTMRDTLYLSALKVQEGFSMVGAVWSYSGYSVSDAGDVNGDRFDDVLVGSVPFKTLFGTQTTYLVYGGPSISVDAITLPALSDQQGVVISGGGVVVSGVGDINHDGLDDILIGSNYGFNGAGFVVAHKLQAVTSSPSIHPTMAPTTRIPSTAPTTRAPTILPSRFPTTSPTHRPTVFQSGPSEPPTQSPTNPTSLPSSRPTFSTDNPSSRPTNHHPSSRPSSRPSSHPSLSPTLASKRPTIVPSTEPTFPSTNVPTTVLAKPSFRSRYPLLLAPSAAPSVLEKTVELYIEVGGEYIRDNENPSNYIVNANETVYIIGYGSLEGDIFTVLPQVNASLHIEIFNNISDKLNLTSHSAIHSISDLVITSGSVIITFPTTGQRIRLANLTPVDISENNFMFAPNATSSSDSISNIRRLAIIYGSYSIGALIALFIAVKIYYFFRAKKNKLVTPDKNPTTLTVDEENWTQLVAPSNQSELYSELSKSVKQALRKQHAKHNGEETAEEKENSRENSSSHNTFNSNNDNNNSNNNNNRSYNANFADKKPPGSGDATSNNAVSRVNADDDFHPQSVSSGFMDDNRSVHSMLSSVSSSKSSDLHSCSSSEHSSSSGHSHNHTEGDFV